MQKNLARKWLALALLCGSGPALAQVGLDGVPDAAGCAALVAPAPRPWPAPLEQAVGATVQAYRLQAERLVQPLATRPPTADEIRRLESLSRETSAYLGRLLGAYGWPDQPSLRAAFVSVLDDATLQFCAGQVGLKAATTPAQRADGAVLVDRGLIGLGESQRYGTVYRQMGRKLVPLDIDDAPNVETRRAEAGLPSLAAKLAEVQASLPAPGPPPGLKRPVELRPVCQRFTTPAALNTPLTVTQIDQLSDRAVLLTEQDQASRMGQPGARDMRVVDAESTAWLRNMLSKTGWPSANRTDSNLASDAWLLAQHADASTELQACILDLIGQQRSTTREEQNFAYLTDRVRLAQNQPQVYGTQVTYDDVWRKASPRMLKDPAGVNERRAKISLEPIEDYLKRFEPVLK
ncbi:hypothetical protein DESA109040_04085 [Deinococcus saxicola]|uniref:DUF6624 domain-containing protein n=1 Tax=Deinococcus saxicola TaxID=249406 RepID=UPI0039F04C5C